MNFEAPLTSLVWITSMVSIIADLPRFVGHHSLPWAAIPHSGGSWQRSCHAEPWRGQ